MSRSDEYLEDWDRAEYDRGYEDGRADHFDPSEHEGQIPSSEYEEGYEMGQQDRASIAAIQALEE